MELLAQFCLHLLHPLRFTASRLHSVQNVVLYISIITVSTGQMAIRCMMPAHKIRLQTTGICTLPSHVVSLLHSPHCFSSLLLVCNINLLASSSPSHTVGGEVALCQLLATSR